MFSYHFTLIQSFHLNKIVKLIKNMLWYMKKLQMVQFWFWSEFCPSASPFSFSICAISCSIFITLSIACSRQMQQITSMGKVRGQSVKAAPIRANPIHGEQAQKQQAENEKQMKIFIKWKCNARGNFMKRIPYFNF